MPKPTITTPPGSTSAAANLRWVRAFRKALVAHTPELLDLAEHELGKPRFETLTSDLVPLLASCKWHEKHARRVLRTRKPRGRSIWQLGQRHRIARAPLGHIAIIATWNYPIQLLGIQLIQAITAGNRVTVKPSERAPNTQARLLELAAEALATVGLPATRLTCTEGTREAGETLLREQRFDHVVFTGSTAVGRSIAASLAESLTPSTLELSGCDSALVLRDADVNLAARSIAFACTLNRGQTCMAPRRVIVHHDLAEALQAELESELAARPLTPGLDSAEWARTAELLKAEGIEAPDPAGFTLATTNPDSPLARGEHFGPAAAFLTATSDAHAIELHQLFQQHLATSVFTRDVARARQLATSLRVGVVTINDTIIPTAHPGTPITGRGLSGHTPSRGAEGLLAMTQPVVIAATGRRIRTPLTVPDEATQRRMLRFVRWWYR